MSRAILICGGAGFVGSSLAVYLKQQHPDWQIVCLDNLRRRGSELNLQRFKGLGIEFLHGDIRSPEDLDFGNVDTILDCSAEPSVLAGFASPQYVLQTNLVGTINILECARRLRAKLLFLSTSRVYPIEPLRSLNLVEQSSRFELSPEQILPGVSQQGIAEAFPLQGYRSIYGTTKLASELLIEEYRQAYGLQAIVNRCGVITGPWQMGKVDQGVFVLWLAAHYFRKPLAYIGYGGTGKQLRDLIHIDDLARLIDLQIQQFDLLDGDVLNVGGGLGRSLSLAETTKLCQEITGNVVEIRTELEARAGDIPVFVTDCSRIMAKTGWSPTLTPEKTLCDIYEWIAAHEAELRPILA
jgi:CDP-paratose 2-epimerase